MYILVVEDDYLQADWISETLKQSRHWRIDRISTESEFRSRVDEIEKNPPDVIIMDVMLRWTDPSLNLEPPPAEVQKNGFYRAGVRCAELLASRERTRRIPVILYTILERSDLENQLKELSPSIKIVHLRKESDDDRLVDLVRELNTLR